MSFDWKRCLETLQACTAAAHRAEMKLNDLEALVLCAKQHFRCYLANLPMELKVLILTHLEQQSIRGHAMLRAPTMAVCGRVEYPACFRMLTGLDPTAAAARLSRHTQAVELVREGFKHVLDLYLHEFRNSLIGLTVMLRLDGAEEFCYQDTDGGKLGWILALLPEGVNPTELDALVANARVPDTVPLTSFSVNLHECCLRHRAPHRQSPFADTDTLSVDTPAGKRIVQFVNTKTLVNVQYETAT